MGPAGAKPAPGEVARAPRRPGSEGAFVRPAWAGRAAYAELPATWVGWRLIGANNRELGRSATAFDSLAACRAAVTQLREGVGQAVALPTLSYTAGTWTWRLVLGGHEVAMSGRTYQRQREAQHNLALFLTAVPLAQVSEVVASRPRLRGLQPGPSGAGRHERGTTREDPDDGAERPPAAVTRGAAASTAGTTSGSRS